jgi:hypothetical protein
MKRSTCIARRRKVGIPTWSRGEFRGATNEITQILKAMLAR